MNKQNLLVEIGLEEMPARVVEAAMEQLGEKAKKWMQEHQLEYGEVLLYSTPRRLAFIIKDVAEAQEDRVIEVKGPSKKVAKTEDGEWSKAALGFTRGQGATTDDIYYKEQYNVEYAFVKKEEKGQKTVRLLPSLQTIISGLTFPVNMHWGNQDLRYIRPIKWLVCLYGETIVPFSIAGVGTSNISHGHRFLGGKVALAEPLAYEKTLLSQYVLVRPEDRKQSIREQLHKLEMEQDWLIPIDEALLEEVNNLVEYPTALYGSFDHSFLQLPEEVLITSMKEHQRYFPVKNREGQLLPYFVTVRNGDHRHLEKVAKGNEKVLRARLADAAFFFAEDQKLDISTALKKLGQVVYHEKIGTIADKVERIRRITNMLTDLLGLSEQEKAAADRAAEICKFDLVTNMVNEFPELQGWMGEQYALQKGESPEVAKAIKEHYQPRHAKEEAPASNVSAVVAIADKIDTIVSCFAVGIIPTGSQDPYALRRQAAGIVQILIAHKWDVSLLHLLDKTVQIIEEDKIGADSDIDLRQTFLAFLKLRIKNTLQDIGIRYDIIEAVLKSSVDLVPKLVERALVLNKAKDSNEFKSTIEALSRVMNIAKNVETSQPINPTLFDNEYEKELYKQFTALKGNLHELDMKAAFQALGALKQAIEHYFDHTMVMSEDESLKMNRLAQMKELADLIKNYAAMNDIIVK
ncbi:glycine--tRNA ligase subunit beta [Bacillus chungangensis]|uniref:Glycine--tRNA ligase beta subunit n=1 Tax=Bacillus chungangensis TaxID=587633 RepID=A0ABT9WLK7_9BACI|nr:glycine--tRNA ligase subunit beta [Bacillus chungangensis]MDQ0174172.1 glycyl-tRNA synthetase beta chain [Bacillus chungangensis]